MKVSAVCPDRVTGIEDGAVQCPGFLHANQLRSAPSIPQLHLCFAHPVASTQLSYDTVTLSITIQ